MSDKEMQDAWIEKRDSDDEQLTMDFAKEILGLDLQIKEINDSKKAIKTDAKANGIAIKQVNSALKKLKDAAKKDPLEEQEEDFYVEKFGQDIEIQAMIAELNRKD